MNDNLICPDCGQVAVPIGVEYETFQAGEPVIAFRPEPLSFRTNKRGEQYRSGEKGVHTISLGTKDVTRHGITVQEDVKRDVLLVTHRCTNPDCMVVFPREYGRRS